MVRRDASATVVAMELTPLRRASSGAVLGGVCAGLARRWQVDPTVLRIAMVLLALLGGLLGAGIAWLVFNGYTVSTLGQNFSQVVFQFRVSPELLWSGLKWALGIGLVGGLFPALRAARLPITTALRET